MAASTRLARLEATVAVVQTATLSAGRPRFPLAQNGGDVVTPTTGRWQVTTETSVYVLDLDDRRATRDLMPARVRHPDSARHQSRRCDEIKGRFPCSR